MTAVTARTAGVKTVWVASPRYNIHEYTQCLYKSRPAVATLAAAFVAGGMN